MPSFPRQPRKVLDEEAYQTNLTGIIQRDYFPDLSNLQREADLQERREAGDFPGAIHIRRQSRQREAQELKEREEEDLIERQAVGSGLRTQARPLHLESLSGFHSRVTSEDNAAFDKVQAEEVELRKSAQAAALLPAQRKRDTPYLRGSTFATSPLLLASDQFNPSLPDSTSSDAWKRQSSNSLFFVPKAVQQHDEGSNALLLKLDGTSSVNATCSNRSESTSLATKADAQSMPPPRSRIESLKSDMVAYIPSTASSTEKAIVPSATRFPTSTHNALIPRPISEWDGETDVNNDDDYSTDGTSTDLDEPPRYSVNVERMQARKRKLKDSNTMVQMTPVIVPGNYDSSPLITWGSIGGTPLVVSGQEGNAERDLLEPSPGEFRIPGVSLRENAAEKAQAEVSRLTKLAKDSNILRKRSKQSSSRTPRPPSSRSASSFGSALRASYLRPSSSSQQLSSNRGSRSTKRCTADTAYRATPKLPPKNS